ncbi:hypothetical protein [Pseudooceanicola sp. 200-1SW]|uniref:hypothetical protein n=1 Tax=Pseudooceanicola sp. 200-1SW TaxID=3425949 RepID=UPI003D7F4231
MEITRIFGDGRLREVRAWQEWLQKIQILRKRYEYWGNGYDLFANNETANVASLGNAATLAGHMALTEYAAVKHRHTRGRAHHNGRYDLWMSNADDSYCWGLEAKSLWDEQTLNQSDFDKRMQAANKDTKAHMKGEADCRVGLFILTIQYRDDTDFRKESIRAHDALVMNSSAQVDLAYRLEGPLADLWLYFALNP